MIGIQLEGQTEFLNLDPESAIEMTLENPLFNESDKLSAGDYSLPFELPGEEKGQVNAAMLKNPDIIENNEAYQVQKAKLFFDRVPFKAGNLTAKLTKGGKISSYFTFGLNTLSSDFKTAKLRDVVAEDVVIDNSSITKKIYIRKRDGSDFDFTLNGKAYKLSNYPAIELDAKAAKDTGTYMPYAEFVGSGASPSGVITAPFLVIYLRTYFTYHDPVTHIDFLLFQDGTGPLQPLSISVSNPEDFLIEGNVGNYFASFNTFFAGYFNGSYPTDKFRMSLRFNENPYGENLKDGTLVNGVNAGGIILNKINPDIDLLASIPVWDNTSHYNGDGSGAGKYCKYLDSNGNYEYWITTYTDNVNHAPSTSTNYWHTFKYYFECKNYNTLQPFLRLKWVLDKIATRFGFSFEGDFYDHADIQNLLIDNPVSLDVPMEFIQNKKFVFWRRSFNLNELTPDITIIEFLKRLQSRYNVGVYLSEITGKVRLQFRENIAKEKAYDDISPLSSPILQNEDVRSTGFTITVPKNNTDKLSVAESITVGIPEDTFTIKCGKLQVMNTNVIDGKAVTGPQVSQPIGADPNTLTFTDDYDLRVFHDKGIVYTGTFSYSSADINGTTIYEGLNDGITLIGLYNAFFKYWLLYQSKRKAVTINVSFPFRSVRQFDWELKRRFDRNNYLVKSIKLRMTTKGFNVSSVLLYTMV